MFSTGMQVLQPPAKTQQPHKSLKNANNANNASSNKRKSKHDRNGRKRSKSFSGCGLSKLMSQKPVPPTKFLLGGNINDPLNLNSLQNEEINRAMNAITPKSSPVPTPPRRKAPIEVIIPPNIRDPLNLIDCADDAEYEQKLCSPVKKCRKKRLKKRRTVSACLTDSAAPTNNNPTSTGGNSLMVTASSGSEVNTAVDVQVGANSEAKTPETSTDSAKIPDETECGSSSTPAPPNNNKDLTLELSPNKKEGRNKRNKQEEHSNTAKKLKYSMDKIVSPVVPQPGAWLKRSTSVHKPKPKRLKPPNEAMPQFKEKNKHFQYGNYNRYYGYRNPHNELDLRLRVFSQHRELFEDKDILDIGCNIGHVTLTVARDFGAKSVTGIDIDPKLISIARKNVQHYVKNTKSPKDCPNRQKLANDDVDDDGEVLDKKSSFNVTQAGRDFPHNVVFKKCNYVLEDDALLALEQPQFDAILCLSITKWIHLNWGDSGLKQAFRRMYAQLRPGGKLILEPQNWASYKSKRKLTEDIYKNYNAIELFPDKFTEYLLSPVVGFAKSEILGYPHHHAKGFQRPIYIFSKSTMFLSERYEATPSNVTPNNPVYDDAVYQKIMKTERYESQTQPAVEKYEHIYYTNILNRYCGNADENQVANELLEEEMKPSAAAPPTSGDVVINGDSNKKMEREDKT